MRKYIQESCFEKIQRRKLLNTDIYKLGMDF